MNTNRSLHLLAAALGLTAFAASGCSERAGLAETSLPDAKGVAATITPPGTDPVEIQVSTPASPDTASARWVDLKDYTYDQRAQFFSGLKLLEAKVDAQIAELTAERAAMNSTVNTKDWDFSMKEMVNARSYLISTGEVLAKATPETWQQEKDKVGLAWVRAQEAYRQVKASTTL